MLGHDLLSTIYLEHSLAQSACIAVGWLFIEITLCLFFSSVTTISGQSTKGGLTNEALDARLSGLTDPYFRSISK
jgi:hypothetical protein